MKVRLERNIVKIYFYIFVRPIQFILMKNKLFLPVILLFGFILSAKSQNDIYSPQYALSDSAQISLLTNTPWDKEVYALFGHTAIRINDPAKGLDIIFNYGLFDFSSPNFMYRFVKGETDYKVGAMDFKYYLLEYKERGVGITEQVLNLSHDEKQKIFNALIINSLPENSVYRYNFFYDNCSTRPRDIIEKNIAGQLVYNPTNKEQTYRDLLHECVNIQPWTKFGIDLVIGADADKIINDRQKDFLPAYLMNAYQGAVIKNADESEREFVTEKKTILVQDSMPIFFFAYEPLLAGCLLLVITALLSWFSYKKNRTVIAKIFDTLLFLTAGLAGSIIFFLMFFSIHPCTNPNWNIVWLNPLQLIVALLFFVKSCSKCVYYYHFINFVALTLFLLAWSLIPQQLEMAFIPFILSIWMRSGVNILQQKKFKKKAVYSLPKIK